MNKHISSYKVLMIFFFLLIPVTFLFFGCADKNVSFESPVSSTEPDYETLYQNETINDVMEGEWIKADVNSPDTFMSLSEYVSDVFPIVYPDKSYYRMRFADDRFIYSFDRYSEPEGSTENYTQTVCLHKLDISDKTVTSTEYFFPDRLVCSFYKPQSIGGRIFASSEKRDEDGNLTECCVIELLPDGTISESANLVDVLKENGLYPEQFYGVDCKLLYEPVSDITYILTPSQDCVIPVDKNGKALAEFTGLEGSKKKTISDFAYTGDGHIIFICSGGGNEDIVIFENNAPKSLYSGKSGSEAFFTDSVIDSHGRVLFSYGTNSVSIISWDTKTGTQENLYSESYDNDYSYGFECFARNDKGEMLLIVNDDLKVFSFAGASQKVEINVTQVTQGGVEFDMYIKKYEQSHPGVTFNTLEKAGQSDADTVFTQMYTDMTRGGGPDMILLDVDRLDSLAKSDCLYELSGVLRDDIKNNIVPAVWESGYIDGGKYAMMMSPNMYTLIISGKYFDGESWTIKDIMNIVEERERSGNPFEQLTLDKSSLSMFIFNICESEFVDMNSHTCTFESDDFVRMLEMCKKYDTADSGKPENSLSLMKEDKALIYVDYLLGFATYSELLASLGEDYRTIGYPHQNGTGKISATTGIAVNKAAIENDADKKAVIEDFLNCMYSPDYLSSVGTILVPTRLDYFDGRILYLGGNPHIKLDSHTYSPITPKADGTTYLDEYVYLLKNCEGMSSDEASERIIKEIILEEAEPFFAGAKSAREVAEIIQSRVSIYLKEIG